VIAQASELRECEIGITPFDCPRDSGLWHYVAAALKQYKLAMATTRSGRDNRSVALRQQGESRTVSAAGPH
jgi:hypothetical protein